MSAVATLPAAGGRTKIDPEADPVGFVRGLPDEQQEAVFVSILKALIADSGGEGLIPIQSDGEWLGYFVPPAVSDAHFERYGPKLTPEEKARVQRSFENPGRSFTLEEMLELLRQGDSAAPPGRESSGIGT